jgi:hypothetical protein
MLHTISIHLPGQSQCSGIENLINSQNNLRLIKLQGQEIDPREHFFRGTVDKDFQGFIFSQETRRVGYEH